MSPASIVFALFPASRLRLVWEEWKTDWESFLRKDAPKILVVLVVAFILVRLLKLTTSKLAKFGRSGALPTGMRAQQLRTLAGVINSWASP